MKETVLQPATPFQPETGSPLPHHPLFQAIDEGKPAPVIERLLPQDIPYHALLGVRQNLAQALNLPKEDDRQPDLRLQLAQILEDAIRKADTGLEMPATPTQPSPEPTVVQPDATTLEERLAADVSRATGGCIVEPDGFCPHHHPSWLRYLEL